MILFRDGAAWLGRRDRPAVITASRSQLLAGRRLMWWFPWSVTDWWRPRFFTGGDEWCNDSACLVIPPLGCLIIFWRWRLRDRPCPEEWAHLDEVSRQDYEPGGRLHGGWTHPEVPSAWEREHPDE